MRQHPHTGDSVDGADPETKGATPAQLPPRLPPRRLVAREAGRPSPLRPQAWRTP